MRARLVLIASFMWIAAGCVGTGSAPPATSAPPPDDPPPMSPPPPPPPPRASPSPAPPPPNGALAIVRVYFGTDRNRVRAARLGDRFGGGRADVSYGTCD